MTRTMSRGRDQAGNIVSDEPAEVRTYNYDTGSIPSKRFEELIAMLAKDYRQGLMQFHQLIQGKRLFCAKNEKKRRADV